jgi:hypothetical protein
LTDQELHRTYVHALNRVRDANGHTDSLRAQKRLELVVRESERRGLDYYNPYPIQYGCGGKAHHDG